MRSTVRRRVVLIWGSARKFVYSPSQLHTLSARASNRGLPTVPDFCEVMGQPSTVREDQAHPVEARAGHPIIYPLSSRMQCSPKNRRP
ncbi:hypothetical protein SBA2_730009 [Acidobacteriia bacterium SbA2]|nr:hypothetical protein SBA2_730009 [Acidobacteriia bacterium SbA2]